MSIWKIDTVHSQIGFKVKHLMVSTVRGNFDKFEGSITSSDDSFENAEAELIVDMGSVNTKNEMRDNHLRSADFFEIETYPSLSFKSKSFKKKENTKFEVIGDLTLRGVTREIILNAVFNGLSIGMDGGRVASFDASGYISRKDYGLLWNKIIESGGVTVSDEVTLEISVEMKELK